MKTFRKILYWTGGVTMLLALGNFFAGAYLNMIAFGLIGGFSLWLASKIKIYRHVADIYEKRGNVWKEE